jgi:F-type H+-transporting ATPase subunit b
MLHLFNFTILFGALYILLYKPVKEFMEKREAHYADMDSRAAAALDEAESSRDSYEKKAREFDEEIRAEKSRMSKEVEAERERRMSEAKSEAEKIVAGARGEAEREKAEILGSAQKEITEMVTEAMEKLTLEQSASDAFDQFLDAAEEAEK